MSLAKGPITVLSDRPAGVRRPAPDHERQDDDDLHYTPGRGDRRGRRRCRHPRRHRIPDATTSATAATTRRPQRLRSRPKAGFEPARNLMAQRAPGRAGAMQHPHGNAQQRKALQRLTAGTHSPWRDYRNRRTSHAPTSTPAIASEGRFERSENLIAQRASGRVGAMQRSRVVPVEGRRPAPDAEGAAINTEPAEGRAAKARPPRALQKNYAVGTMSGAPRRWASASWSSSWVWEARSASTRLR